MTITVQPIGDDRWIVRRGNEIETVLDTADGYFGPDWAINAVCEYLFANML